MATLSLIKTNRYNADSGFGGKVLRYKDFLGCEEEKTLSIEIPANATWYVVYNLAMVLVDSADDKHHTFIEEVHVCDEDPNTVWVETGS